MMPRQATLCRIHNEEDIMKKTNLKLILLGTLVSYYQGKKFPYITCTYDATRPFYGKYYECRFLCFFSSFNVVS